MAFDAAGVLPNHGGMPLGDLVYVDCVDEDLCNGEEICTNGTCQPGTPLVCDDPNPCTDDSCDPLIGCAHVPNTDHCNDGDACTIDDIFSNGIPSKRIFMSSTESIATPALPTSPTTRG